ncbi:hypothetical protein [Acinetobacter variabilis]|uniref:hypothetical protein n=1 Tax=Acinetobacter variabilis TaxID=70346 RepID=UPI0028AB3335|nr:hypothetical protein [Acinetobacter variabilis]
MQQILINTFVLIWLSLISPQLYAVTELNFDHPQYVKLDGEWEFYPNQLIDPISEQRLSPLNSSSQTLAAEKVHLPNSFLTLTGHKDHIGTFQKAFRLPESAINHAVYVYVPYQYGAYRMYVDDHLLIEVGQVGIHGQHQTMMAPKLASFPHSGK